MTEAKPATDEQIVAMRAYLKVEGSPSRWSRHTVIILIARIDAERAAHATLKQRFDDECAAHRLAHQQWLAARDGRLVAEARVKVLEDALRALISAVDDGAPLLNTSGFDAALLAANAALGIATLKARE